MIIIDTVIAIKGYTLTVYYSSDLFYRICIISDRSTVFDLKNIYYCEKLAEREAKAIIRTIS